MKTVDISGLKLKINFKNSKGLQAKFDSIVTIASLFDYYTEIREDKTGEFKNFYRVSFRTNKKYIQLIITTSKMDAVEEIYVEYGENWAQKYFVGSARSNYTKLLKKVEELL